MFKITSRLSRIESWLGLLADEINEALLVAVTEASNDTAFLELVAEPGDVNYTSG
jgi:hypothetical protein